MTIPDVVFWVSLVCGLSALLGWPQGYRAVEPYLAFWGLATLAALTALRIERLGFKSGTRADHLIRMCVVGFGLIVGCGLLLGSIGGLHVAAYLGLLGVALAVAVRASRSAGRQLPPRRDGSLRFSLSPASTIALAIAAPIVVFVVVVGMTHLPLRYDSLNYHLYFPAQWLKAGRIWVVPTPFGDEAPAYAPSNGELFFLSLMLPFHGDLLARIGQLPFYLLAGLVLYALARRAGAPRAYAIYPAVFFLLARPIVEEAVGADVDLIFTATFLAAVYLGMIASETNERNDWMIFGACVGLCCGTKYVALVYGPVFLLLALIRVPRGPRMKSLWALPGIVALGLPWYVRNWILAGSPIYPASLTLAGVTIARGAFSHAAMTNSIFHVTDVRIFAHIAATAAGAPLLLFSLPFVAVGLVRLLTSPPSWHGRLLALLPIAMVPLEWFVVPDNTDPRFLFPVVALALLPLACVFGRQMKWNLAVEIIYVAGLLWLVVGLNTTIALHLADLPDYMRGGVWLGGLVAPPFLPWFGLLAVVAFFGRRLLGEGRPLRRAAVMLLLACAGVGVASRIACPPDGCDLVDLTPSYIGAGMIEGWQWIHANAHGETIAYTGNNIPYPLFGERLTNDVFYVNIDRHADWKLHDYDRARRRRQGESDSEPMLASSSGVLRPISVEAAAAGDTVRPRFERMHGYPDAWLANLKSQGVTMLFVSVLSAYEIDNVWHDADGFPIEMEWARADPAAFTPLFQNRQVAVYAVHLR